MRRRHRTVSSHNRLTTGASLRHPTTTPHNATPMNGRLHEHHRTEHDRRTERRRQRRRESQADRTRVLRFLNPSLHARLHLAGHWARARSTSQQKRIGKAVKTAGFTRCRRAAETPFNLVSEHAPERTSQPVGFRPTPEQSRGRNVVRAASCQLRRSDGDFVERAVTPTEMQ